MKTKSDSQSSKKYPKFSYSVLSKQEKEVLIKASNLILPEKKILTFNDLIQFEKAKEFLTPLKEKYHLTLDSLLSLIKDQIFLPIEIFNKKLTILESITKYLKEEKSFSLKKIANALGRDQRNIWHIYNRSKTKHSKKFIIKDSKLQTPISIFSGKLSALESITKYLKENLSLTYHEIALLLERDDRTIWTVYQRARKKNGK